MLPSAAILLVSALIGQTAAEAGAPRLKDIVLYSGGKQEGSAGAATGFAMDAGPGGLPQDQLESYNGQKALRLLVSGVGAEWWVNVPGIGWATFDLQPYWANGSFEFAVKGRKGGEQIKVSILDNDPIRRRSTVFSEQIAVPSTEWSVIKIPLKRLIPDPEVFRLRQSWYLRLSGSSELAAFIGDIRFVSPDQEPGSPPIKVNQLGYDSASTKRAIVSGFAPSFRLGGGSAFRVVNERDAVVFRGRMSLLAERDPVSGERLLAADFSALRSPGKYRIMVDGLPESPVFEIGRGLYSRLLKDAARYFYFQRSGMALSERFAGDFARAEGHPGDRNLAFLSGQPGRRDVHGGWYDAGDYGKYVGQGAIAVRDLLLAYEFFPKAFPDRQLGIPESGNGQPDLLDEARWELEWIMRMQDEASGGFHHKIWPNSSNQTPAQDKTERFIYDKAGAVVNLRPTSATGAAAGVLAHAAVVYRPFDPAFADRCLAAAKKGWDYLEANPGNIVASGMTYEDADDSDERMWAAMALYRATNGEGIHDFIKARARGFSRLWQSTNDNAGGDATLFAWPIYLRSARPDPGLRAWHRDQFSLWRTTQMVRNRSLPWRNFLLEEDYYWGSNYAALGTVVALWTNGRAAGVFGPSDAAATLSTMDYVLGVNPLRFSYVSGYGEESVKRIYSQIYNNDRIDPIPPGILAGGANRYEGRFFSHFAGKRYRDVPTEWTTNENAIYWNASLVFAAAALAAKEGPGG